MEVVKVDAYYTTPQGLKIVDLTAACPTGESASWRWGMWTCWCLICIDWTAMHQWVDYVLLTGGVTFVDGMISWNIPRYITPLVDGRLKILEMHMGINGKRLDKAQMVSRGYKLSSKEYHIVIEIPVGSPDGYYKVRLLHVIRNASYWVAGQVFYLNRMNYCRAMPQITSTTSPTLWNPCLSCCGLWRILSLILDTRFCSRSQPLWCSGIQRLWTASVLFKIIFFLMSCNVF